MTQPASNLARSSTATDASVAWLVERAHLADDMAPLAAASADGGALVQALVADGKTPEAFRVIAAALPPREGVWWAWVSARHATQLAAVGGEPPAPLTETLCRPAVRSAIVKGEIPRDSPSIENTYSVPARAGKPGF